MFLNLKSPERLWKKVGAEHLMDALAALNASIRNSFKYKVKFCGETLHIHRLQGDEYHKNLYPRVAWGSGFVAFKEFDWYQLDENDEVVVENGVALRYSKTKVVTNSLDIPDGLIHRLEKTLKTTLELGNAEHRYALRTLARDKCLASWQIPGFAEYVVDSEGKEARLEDLKKDDWIYEIEARVDDLSDLSKPEDRREVRSDFKKLIS